MNNKKKIVLLVVAFVLTIAASVGVTLAWLTAKSDDVTNTFAPSTINIELTETKGTDVANGKSFLMVPGHVLDKDPKVTVKADSEDCYVFIKVTKVNDPDAFLTYTIASDWTELPNVDGVYYRIVEKNATVDQSFDILADNKVTVKQDVTKTQMENLKNLGEQLYPKLTFKAYAVQSKNTANTEFTPQQAWAEVNK
ncbi:MAG: hypothetical protein IJN86_06945 [Clostridia bacterium]|nr:hypothetical protein [Clostridia bacterium]